MDDIGIKVSGKKSLGGGGEVQIRIFKIKLI